MRDNGLVAKNMGMVSSSFREVVTTRENFILTNFMGAVSIVGSI